MSLSPFQKGPIGAPKKSVQEGLRNLPSLMILFLFRSVHVPTILDDPYPNLEMQLGVIGVKIMSADIKARWHAVKYHIQFNATALTFSYELFWKS